MEQTPSHCADTGWGLLVLGIVTWDLVAPETLSHGARRYMESPAGRFLWCGVVGATALHLLDLYPEGMDPFKRALEWRNLS